LLGDATKHLNQFLAEAMKGIGSTSEALLVKRLITKAYLRGFEDGASNSPNAELSGGGEQPKTNYAEQQ